MGCPQMFQYGSTIGVPQRKNTECDSVFLQFSTDNWKIRVRNHSCPPDQKTLQGLATLLPRIEGSLILLARWKLRRNTQQP